VLLSEIVVASALRDMPKHESCATSAKRTVVHFLPFIFFALLILRPKKAAPQGHA
jgi:hypothetical protein